MKGHYGHKSTQRILSQRYREPLRRVRSGFLHQRWHAGDARAASQQSRDLPHARQTSRAGKALAARAAGKFRVVYVGSVQNFYGRMLCSLIERIEATDGLEIIVVGPNADWPKPLLERARANGTYLGFKPPEEAAEELASADALLSVMSFEKEHELFMRTSFTTKFLDYVAFGKPVILWGPESCTPVRVARQHGGAAVVSTAETVDAVVSVCREIAADTALDEKLSKQALQLRQTLFNPDRLQAVFVGEIEKLVHCRARASLQAMS